MNNGFTMFLAALDVRRMPRHHHPPSSPHFAVLRSAHTCRQLFPLTFVGLPPELLRTKEANEGFPRGTAERSVRLVPRRAARAVHVQLQAATHAHRSSSTSVVLNDHALVDD